RDSANLAAARGIGMDDGPRLRGGDVWWGSGGIWPPPGTAAKAWGRIDPPPLSPPRDGEPQRHGRFGAGDGPPPETAAKSRGRITPPPLSPPREGGGEPRRHGRGPISLHIPTCHPGEWGGYGPFLTHPMSPPRKRGPMV